jgi:NTP pyrophosphatase (non-canonical NTP hydrolase)
MNVKPSELPLNELAAVIYDGNRQKGFWDENRTLPHCVALIMTELAEAIEADTKNLQDDKLPQYHGVHVELGDAFIRLFDLIGRLGIDIAAIVDAKLAYNATRPYKHGKKY